MSTQAEHSRYLGNPSGFEPTRPMREHAVLHWERRAKVDGVPTRFEETRLYQSELWRRFSCCA